nr:hypothetical protein [Nitrospirota bacterium]
MKQWSRPFLPLMLLAWMGATGCSEGAKLMKETETGGIVVYPFKGESGYMYSKFRKDAFEIIEQRCPAGYTVEKEAEAKGRVRVQELAGTQEAIAERRWGIQFRCK